MRSSSATAAAVRDDRAALPHPLLRSLLVTVAVSRTFRWQVAGIKAAFAEFSALCRSLATRPHYAAALLGALVALAAGVFAARECATLLRRHAEQLMGRPALVRTCVRARTLSAR